MGSSPTRSEKPTTVLVAMAAAVPVVAMIVGIILFISWKVRLPEPLATHWGAGGTPDGFTSQSVLFWALVVIGAGAVLLSVLVIRGVGEPNACAYAVAGIAGVSAFVYLLVLAAVGVQRGLDDVSEARFPGWWAAIAAVVAAAVAVSMYRLAPRWSVTDPPSGTADATALPVGPTERVVWTRSVLSNGVVMVLMVFGVLGVGIVAVLNSQWWMLSLAAGLAVLAVAFRGVRVTVDPGGLTVKSVVRWPRVVIPVSEVSAVRLVYVSALQDFGGYGYRFGLRGEVKGAKGFVLRSGDGILVDRIGGGREVVVVDDAETAVRLLEAYRQRGEAAA